MRLTRAFAAFALVFTLDSCAPSPHAASVNKMDDERMTLPPLGGVAGELGSVAALATANPYQDNPQAIQQGKQLFVKMNCAGCHAYDASGNMGPSLVDTAWRYGGLPIQIYKSIQEGRPQGMPSWGRMLPPDDTWKLVAYIQSLGGSTSDGVNHHAEQGDRPGEQVAPEARADVQPARQKP
jgi:cytochrome c oxidase cbb3-type subunit 3